MGGVTRAIFGGGGGGGSSAPQQSGTQVVKNETTLPSYVQPYYEEALESAQQQFQTPNTLFSGSYVVPFSQSTQQGLDQATALAQQGSPLINNAVSNATDTLGGTFLNAGNPYFQSAINSAIDPIESRVNSVFSRGGRLGSGANQDVLAKAIGDVTSRMSYDNFAQERQNQLATQRLAPIIRGQQFEDSQKLLNLGQVVEDQKAKELQEEIMRSQFAQTEPQDRLNQYLASITGATRGGTTSSIRPIYGSNNRSSSFLNPLGVASVLGGLGGLFS